VATIGFDEDSLFIVSLVFSRKEVHDAWLDDVDWTNVKNYKLNNPQATDESLDEPNDHATKKNSRTGNSTTRSKDARERETQLLLSDR
jgi:hypothetical protein